MVHDDVGDDDGGSDGESSDGESDDDDGGDDGRDNECSTFTEYLEPGQQSDDNREESNSQRSDTVIEIREFPGSPQNVDLQALEKVTNSQKGDTTTISFSSPSQTITMDSQDLCPTKDLQTLDEVTNSQKSDITTIALSSPSQTITIGTVYSSQ
ncbi:Hypothetical predicted protein [Paramuricea clavata]|uniref:Uncharacterized protein n=1 Tax=Paramuricea clavata TaxID=317549 RepID=A0A7D9L081_PARCT|nr:Hypothetical predicted protein [Paramuricea clavata]